MATLYWYCPHRLTICFPYRYCSCESRNDYICDFTKLNTIKIISKEEFIRDNKCIKVESDELLIRGKDDKYFEVYDKIVTGVIPLSNIIKNKIDVCVSVHNLNV